MDFAISLNNTRSIAKKLESECQTYSSCMQMMVQLKDACSVSGRPGESLRRTMNAVLQNMEKDKYTLASMASALGEIQRTYGDYERRIVSGDFRGTGTGGKPSKGNASAGWYNPTSVTESDEFIPMQWKWSDTWKIVSQFGIIGNIASLSGTWATSDDWVKNLLSSGKFLSKVIGGGASAVSKGGDIISWLQELTGFSKPIKSLNTTGFGDTWWKSFSKQFTSDLNFSGAKTTAEKVKVGAKWAGHVLTFLTNGYENYQEADSGGISAGRAVAETVLETGVDIGLAALSTATVSGVAAALGFVGAPAVAIGAGAAMAVWAANGVCKWICHDDKMDIGEVIADGVCDGIEWTAKKVSDGVKTAWKNVCSWFS